MSDLRDIAVAAFFLWLMVDSIVVFRHKTGSQENRDRSSLAILMTIGPIAYAVCIALAYGSTGAFDWPALQAAGLVAMALGIALRATAIVQLGRFHSPNVSVRVDHQLIQTGLYRYVRHPSYLGALIGYAGFSVALGNWLSVVIMLVVTPSIYLYRIREEDAALAAALGDPYRAYCERTKRLIPWVY